MKAIVCQNALRIETDKAMQLLKDSVSLDGLKFEYRKGRLSAFIAALEIIEFSLSPKQFEKSEINSKLKQAKFCIVQCSKAREEMFANGGNIREL